MKICRVCNIELTGENWFVSLKKRGSCICKKCNNDKMQQWRRLHREQANELALKHYRKNPKKHHLAVNKSRVKVRLDMIIAYGGKCVNCGITDFDVIDLDHINNNGAEHRRKNLYGYNLYRYLKKLNFPKDEYQLLCRNCNWKKELQRRKSSKQ